MLQPAPSLESMQQNRFRAAASRTMLALHGVLEEGDIDATDEPSSPDPTSRTEASGDLRRKQLKKRQGSLAGRLGHEEAKSEPVKKKKGFANLFGKAQHAFHHEDDACPSPGRLMVPRPCERARARSRPTSGRCARRTCGSSEVMQNDVQWSRRLLEVIQQRQLWPGDAGEGLEGDRERDRGRRAPCRGGRRSELYR